MTGWLAGVHRQAWGTSGGAWTRPPSIICLHSTEGAGWPDYGTGRSAPHFTLHPVTGERRQHIPLTVAARALAHPPGTPETNRAGVIQIEIIGTSDRRLVAPGRIYLPHLDTAGRGHVARLMAEIADSTGIPLVTNVEWVDYPSSYGLHARQRLGWAGFATYRGVLAHQHVPGNDHGDVPLPIDQILIEARRLTARPSEEDDMTPEQSKKLDQTLMYAKSVSESFPATEQLARDARNDAAKAVMQATLNDRKLDRILALLEGDGDKARV